MPSLLFIDLLRNPKPWNKLKSGRDTFKRMHDWLNQSDEQKLKQLDLWDEVAGKGGNLFFLNEISINKNHDYVVILPPKPKRKLSGSVRSRSTPSPDEHLVGDYVEAPEAPFIKEEICASGGPGADGSSPLPKRIRCDSSDTLSHIKRQRLVFTDIQKRTLQVRFY